MISLEDCKYLRDRGLEQIKSLGGQYYYIDSHHPDLSHWTMHIPYHFGEGKLPDSHIKIPSLSELIAFAMKVGKESKKYAYFTFLEIEIDNVNNATSVTFLDHNGTRRGFSAHADTPEQALVKLIRRIPQSAAQVEEK